MNSRVGRIIGGSALVVAAAAAAYPVPVRRWYLTWGARPEEVTGDLPGDDLLPDPAMLFTRAIGIAAPPEAIWPWLVQLGSGRGGAYTYDWIENLFGLDMHSADEILPEHQHLKVGDVLPVGPDTPGMRVEILDPGHALVFRSADRHWVWAFVLHPEGEVTRLLSRNRVAAPSPSVARRLVNRVVLEPGSLIMERKMLLGIRQRAERRARRGTPARPPSGTGAVDDHATAATG